MAHPLLRIWEINMRFMWRGVLVIVREDLVMVWDLHQGRYAHCKARHGKQLLDRGYKIHAVAGDRNEAMGRAELVLHVDGKKSWFESHKEETWLVKVEAL